MIGNNPEQAKDLEMNFWDKVADERIYAAFSEKEYNEIFDKNLKDVNGGFALDIGCASGVASVILARRGFKVMGIDISPRLIRQAKRLWDKEENIPQFTVGDAENLPLKNETCDVCFLGGVIHHFPDYQKIIEELHRVLKKGGKLLMIEPNALDIIERISWFFAGKLNLLSPNEYPVSPLEIREKLSSKFGDFEIYPIRTDDIPFFTFVPLVGKYFRGGKGKTIKKIPLAVLNLFRQTLERGNFFVLSCAKK